MGLSNAARMRFQPRRNPLTKRTGVARRERGGGGRWVARSGRVLGGKVSSASPPPLTSHTVATAMASPRRAARSGGVRRVYGPCQPPRVVRFKPGSIQARNPYQQPSLPVGGKAVKMNPGSC